MTWILGSERLSNLPSVTEQEANHVSDAGPIILALTRGDSTQPEKTLCRQAPGVVGAVLLGPSPLQGLRAEGATSV